MKTGFLAIVLVYLTAHSLAEADGADGVQCVHKCLGWEEGTDTSVARSAFRVEDPRCQGTESFLTCVEGCPVERYVILAREAKRIHEKYCDDGTAETTKEKFINDVLRFQAAWETERQKCMNGGDNLEERIATNCVFGSALTSAEKGFDSDVVSFSVNTYKISYGAAVEPVDGGNLPSSCGMIFQPNLSGNYPPYPPHTPYEGSNYQPYQHNYYQPYQRKSYQPYQRNNYQPYQSYKRGSYRAYQRRGYQRYQHRN